jgi:hypothetical protein
LILKFSVGFVFYRSFWFHPFCQNLGARFMIVAKGLENHRYDNIP